MRTTKMELETTARTLGADGKGILVADETVATVTKRLGAVESEKTRGDGNGESTEQ
ncbi:MAG TPA: class I fructose-bisphosphate aldolase [Vicinamibacteria bacterium]|nr:class I fructose-bisphosphate aldolase [Vicinamibacteria bacterium]